MLVHFQVGSKTCERFHWKHHNQDIFNNLVPLGCLIVGRDVFLGFRTAYFRYTTLPEPVIELAEFLEKLVSVLELVPSVCSSEPSLDLKSEYSSSTALNGFIPYSICLWFSWSPSP